MVTIEYGKMKDERIVYDWFTRRARVRHDNAQTQELAQKEDDFIMFLLVANNTNAAKDIVTNPEVLRTDRNLTNLMNETLAHETVQELYALCPEYIQRRDAMVTYYRQKVQGGYGGQWLENLRALTL